MILLRFNEFTSDSETGLLPLTRNLLWCSWHFKKQQQYKEERRALLNISKYIFTGEIKMNTCIHTVWNLDQMIDGDVVFLPSSREAVKERGSLQGRPQETGPDGALGQRGTPDAQVGTRKQGPQLYAPPAHRHGSAGQPRRFRIPQRH